MPDAFNILDTPSPLGDLPRSYQATSAGTGSVTVANRAEWVRAVGAGTISKLAVHIGVQSGNVCVAVYANNGLTGRAARPGVRKATSGSVACPATGYAEIALGASVSVVPGDWFYFGVDNGTATWVLSAAGLTSALADGLAGFASSAFPAADPAPALTSAWNRTPLMVGVA